MTVAVGARARERHIAAMSLTCEILGHILKNISQEQAQDLRDGPLGWSIVEIVCHLRDYNVIFRQRGELMCREDYPRLPAYDHEALAIERAYQDEAVAYAYYELKATRERLVAFFNSLTDEQWRRGGIHPESGDFGMTDALLQVVFHDLDHLEQITRVLEQQEPNSGVVPDIDDDD